jgi:hypothetical protein
MRTLLRTAVNGDAVWQTIDGAALGERVFSTSLSYER